tara:strand:- start:1156 stop:1554 length:399 start_codon:yes stop_codon:yes gene_type:complete
MSDNKPVSFGDIADPSAPPKTASDAAERLHASLEKVKGSMFDDETFVENILRKCVDSPGSFVRERSGEVSGAEKKIERHTLQGRTNKTKLIVYLSDTELAQLDSLVKQRGDRGKSDLVNQVLCTGLGALRKI